MYIYACVYVYVSKSLTLPISQKENPAICGVFYI